MTWEHLKDRIATTRVPLVLSGPIVRQAERGSVTVWVALKEPRKVTLRVYGTPQATDLKLIGTRNSIELGQYLHLVTLTATPISTQQLDWGQLYYYNLTFGSVGNESVDVPETAADLFAANIIAADVVKARLTLLYLDAQGAPMLALPSFPIPPDDLNGLRLVHASCRKPHGEAYDALTTLDEMIRTTLTSVRTRPQQLFLTGDQIYADDVADTLLEVPTEAGDTLLGWPQPETLPGVNKKAAELKPGRREGIVGEKGAKFTTDHGKSHLLSLGEFFAMYLFAWSSVLWPPDLPEFLDVYQPGTYTPPTAPLLAEFSEHRSRVKDYLTALPAVRRAMAHIPTYMIFDDHEITDDWYITQKWCEDVLQSPLGRRVLLNGLSAFAVFQAWGNTPEQFASQGTTGEPGRKLLQALQQWQGISGTATETEIALRVGLPSAASVQSTKKLEHPSGALDWHFTIRGLRYEVIILDTRTWRGYPNGRRGSPALIADPAALARQMPAAPLATDGVTLVISPGPMIGALLPEVIQESVPFLSVASKDAEAWGFGRRAFELLLAQLFLRSDRVVVLSGDVHYGFSAHLRYWATRPYGSGMSIRKDAVLAQLTSSSLKNEARSGVTSTHRLHNGGYTPVGQRPQQWVGWESPALVYEQTPVGIGVTQTNAKRPVVMLNFLGIFPVVGVSREPEWRYRVDFLLSQPRAATPAAVPAPQTWGPASLQSTYLATAKEYEKYQETYGPGREIVGFNNLGEVTFTWGSADADRAVIHQLWWKWAPTVKAFPLSKFVVRLQLNDSSYPAEPDPVPTVP